jgi:N-acetylmuramic acid 6-phosphate etherase
MQDRSHLLTEQRLPESMKLDAMSVSEIVALMNEQDARAVAAVAEVQSDIVRGVELVVHALSHGGRLFYYGAGSSGRLGVLDAAECPPTFRSDPQQIQGIIAGGDAAMFKAQEGAEDRPEDGAASVDSHHIGVRDVVCGIAAGGTTPFVRGALRRAADRGAKTIFLTCVQSTPKEPSVDVVIRPLVGPEIVTGSTRLKAGTATKLVLNSLTTVAMVQLGKVYENLMVDLKATNQKLWDRGSRIISSVTGIERDEAMELLRRANGHVKAAIIMHGKEIDLQHATRLLHTSGGSLRKALNGTKFSR